MLMSKTLTQPNITFTCPVKLLCNLANFLHFYSFSTLHPFLNTSPARYICISLYVKMIRPPLAIVPLYRSNAAALNLALPQRENFNSRICGASVEVLSFFLFLTLHITFLLGHFPFSSTMFGLKS